VGLGAKAWAVLILYFQSFPSSKDLLAIPSIDTKNKRTAFFLALFLAFFRLWKTGGPDGSFAAHHHAKARDLPSLPDDCAVSFLTFNLPSFTLQS